MLSPLLQFEYFYQARQRSLIFLSALFLGMGWIMGAKGYAAPNLYFNSPYLLAHNTALLSLTIVLPVLFFTVSGLLRDQLYQFESILFSTAIRKSHFFWSRLGGVLSMSTLAFSMALVGIALGFFTGGFDADRLAPWQWWPYLYLWLVFVLPNVLICTAITFSVGLLSRNRTAVYATAIGIYTLYWLCAIFLNSPLLAASQPPEPENMIWAAVADPFGISAFLEQCMFWTPAQKNQLLPSFTGYFLLNRVFWLMVSTALLAWAYRRFSFRQENAKVASPKVKTELSLVAEVSTLSKPAVEVQIKQWKSLGRSLAFELNQLLRSWPFLLMLGLWIVIVSTEVYFRIHSGGAYNDSLYPTTALLVWLIEDPLPFLSLLLLLFYSGELLWRDRELNIDGILGTCPVSNQVRFASKAAVLFSIPFLLMFISVLLAIGFQLAGGYGRLELHLYFAMFYFSGVPLLFYATVILLVQLLLPRKYLGMIMAFIFFVGTQPFFASQMGLQHPLLHLGSFPDVLYTDMNGFGDTSRPFHHFALHWALLGALLLFVSYQLWPRGAERSLKVRWQMMCQQWRWPNTVFLCGASLLILLSGARIYQQLNVEVEYRSPTTQLDFREDYERKYKQEKTPHRLFPRAVTKNIDLYPIAGKYRVVADYTVQNKSDTVITRLFITERVPLTELQIPGATLLARDTFFQTRLYQLDEPLQPGETLSYHYELEWERRGHQTSRSLQENGTYLMRSEYDPVLNYRPSLEIKDPSERSRRGLPPLEIERAKEEHLKRDAAAMGKIDFECTISTTADQVAIAPGARVKSWMEGARSYFHYRSTEPMLPILSFFSARYARLDTMVNGIQLELYYHPTHPYNISRIQDYAIRTLQYCEKNFGKYPLDHLRIAEIPGHWPFGGQALAGTISMVADRLYLTDMRDPEAFDLVAKRTIHEVAHQWWGGVLCPKNTPGSTVIIEGLAKYTEAAVMAKTDGLGAIWQLSQTANNTYFRGRADALEPEPPLFLSEDESYLSYGKNLLAMIATQELLGEARMNDRLRGLVEQFANETDPTATIKDLLAVLSDGLAPSEQQLINDWFKKRITYDLRIEDVTLEPLPDGRYELNAKIVAERMAWDSMGIAQKIPLDEPIAVSVFSHTPRSMKAGDKPDYNQLLNLVSGRNELSFTLDEPPTYLVIDPFGTRPETKRTDNLWSF